MTIISDVEVVCKGLKIETSDKVSHTAGDVWTVTSASDATKHYTVNAARETCTCPQFTYRGQRCKHIVAVNIHRERERRNAKATQATQAATWSTKPVSAASSAAIAELWN
jgi:predicted nucleic acid-binding Zn finger protein